MNYKEVVKEFERIAKSKKKAKLKKKKKK